MLIRTGRSSLIAFGTLAGLSLASFADAKTPEEDGAAVARDLGTKTAGGKDLSGDVDMKLEDGSGGTASRKFRIKALERPDAESGDWIMVVFDAPADVTSTSSGLTCTRLVPFAYFAQRTVPVRR